VINVPDIIFDFSEAKVFDRTPVPAGIYRATIDASYAKEVRYGRQKGTPYVTLGFVVSSPEEYSGKVLFNNYMIAGPGAGASRNLLEALGYYSEEYGQQIRFNPNVLHGIEVEVRVRETTTNNGDPANEITGVFPARKRITSATRGCEA
jgi:hypothetical protein